MQVEKMKRAGDRPVYDSANPVRSLPSECEIFQFQKRCEAEIGTESSRSGMTNSEQLSSKLLVRC